MIGIYKITCSGNNKVYIGQSVAIGRRWATHKRELSNGTHSNKYLQRAYDKYGEKSFSYEVIELCKKEKLNEREQFYIKIFDSYRNGFNCDLGGRNISNEVNPMYKKSGKLSPRFVDIIYQLDNKGQIINKYESANLAAKAIGGQAAHIQDCLKTWKKHTPSTAATASRERMTHKGFYWIYEKDYKILLTHNYDFTKKRTKKSLTIQDLVNDGALDGDI